MKTFIALLVVAVAVPLGANAAADRSSGTLTLNAPITSVYTFIQRPDCPPGTPETARECVRFVSLAGIPGLGRSTITYVKYFDETLCPNRVLNQTSSVIDVEGKGQINITHGRLCGDYAPASTVLDGTISGGTGKFAGASGSLRLASTTSAARCGNGGICFGTGSDTWTGNLSVPGVEFDVAPPVLQGARSKSVKAPWKARSVRVRYSVTAQDGSGSVAATCLPRSGSRFKVGRTKVKCTAEDASANVAAASFTVTVKRARR